MRRLFFRLFGAVALGAGLGAGSFAMAQTETVADAPADARALAVTCADDEATADGLRPTCDESIAFVEVLVRDAFFVWSDDQIPDDERMGRFHDVLSEGLAIDFLANFMLRDQYREAASEEELAQYHELFPNYIMQVYAEQIGKITRNRLDVVDAAPAGRRDVNVRTHLERSGSRETVDVDWRVRKMGEDALKVINITANGVSIMIVRRSEFSTVIDSGGMAGLLAVLREKTEQS